MASIAPSVDIVNALESGVVEVTRRMEVYEADGVTPWYAHSEDYPFTNRLVDGSITVDYNSDERRKGDITLLNDDFAFRLNPIGGFYYDKIIKLYRGLKYPVGMFKPQVALIESDWTGDNLTSLKRAFADMGYELVDKTTATVYGQIEKYPIIAGMRNTSGMSKAALMYQAFSLGHQIFTMSQGGSSASIPHITTTTSAAGENVSLSSVAADHPLKGRIPATTANVLSGAAGLRVTALGVSGVSIAFNGNVAASLISTMGTHNLGAKWLNFQSNGIILATNLDVIQHVKTALDYMTTRWESEMSWETQLGEFMIDSVDDQVFPDQIKITFRDYTKKLIKDKLTDSATFVAGTPLKSFVRAIASNGGITRFRESIGTEVFPNDMSFDRDAERWKMIKDACTAFDYEVFCDNEGYLVARKFNDPTTAPLFHSFGTGSAGNLVSFSRSINDSRIYNIINVFGDPINNDRLPYFGQAVNDNPNSPTSTVKLGKRPFTYAFNYFTSDAECLALANSRIRVMGLESYDINFASLYYPWMEVGEIVQILDPNANATDPTRFLLDSITLPLGLQPMSGTAKRVTLVGSSG